MYTAINNEPLHLIEEFRYFLNLIDNHYLPFFKHHTFFPQPLWT